METRATDKQGQGRVVVAGTTDEQVGLSGITDEQGQGQVGLSGTTHEQGQGTV